MSRNSWKKIFRFGQFAYFCPRCPKEVSAKPLLFGRTGRFVSSRPRCPIFFQTICSHFGQSGQFAYFAYPFPELSRSV
ncbi:hypothetical protein KI387_002637, partial [Taxus chinensis]